MEGCIGSVYPMASEEAGEFRVIEQQQGEVESSRL